MTEIDPKVQVYVKMPISRFNRLQEHVCRCGTTMAEFIRAAISEKLAVETLMAREDSK